MKFNKTIVLISGTSGVGKTTLIHKLCYLYPRIYSNIKSFTTRPLREKNDDRKKINKEKFLRFVKEGRIILPNKVYGNFYGLSKEEIIDVLNQDKIPICDWPVYMINDFKRYFPGINVLSFYLLPPDLIELRKRLSSDGRDKNNLRYMAALTELKRIKKGNYNRYIDVKFLNKNGINSNASKLHSIIFKSVNGEKWN